MTNSAPTNDQQFTQPKKRSPWPWILGCSGAGCLGVILLIIGGVWYGVWWVKSFVQDEPTVELYQPAQEEVQAVKEKIETYQQRVNAGEAGDDEMLVLDSHEINTLIAENNTEKSARVNVQLEGDQVKAAVSLPWETGEEPSYINGEAVLTVNIKDGLLDVRITEMSVRGRDLPESLKEGFSQENMAKDVNSDPQMRKNFQRVESLEVKDSKMYIKLKPQEEGEAEEGEEAPAEPASDSPQPAQE